MPTVENHQHIVSVTPKVGFSLLCHVQSGVEFFVSCPELGLFFCVTPKVDLSRGLKVLFWRPACIDLQINYNINKVSKKEQMSPKFCQMSPKCVGCHRLHFLHAVNEEQPEKVNCKSH